MGAVSGRSCGEAADGRRVAHGCGGQEWWAGLPTLRTEGSRLLSGSARQPGFRRFGIVRGGQRPAQRGGGEAPAPLKTITVRLAYFKLRSGRNVEQYPRPVRKQ